jgi:hypothetical protein
MDNTALKKFAVSARIKLIDGVKARAKIFGIEAKGIKELEKFDDVLMVNGEPAQNRHKLLYNHLVSEIKKHALEYPYEEAYEIVMEEVAYTWFNRLIAIRFMEIHDYLPIQMHLLSSTENRPEPDAVCHVNQLIDTLSLDQAIVWKYQDDHNQNELFKYLLVHQSHQLGELIPEAFSAINSAEELLLPDNLLGKNNVIDELINSLDDSNWDEVEVVGWLYQFYNSEVKERVGGLKNNAVSKRYLPTVTQLFTPKWIVKYMLQNSLGKLYMSLYPNSKLYEQWEYYLTKDETPSKIVPEHITKVEDVKMIDPACGSGHILIEAFDLFYQMYLERGYNPREIPAVIMENNIYGMEIDKRSAQIAHICLVLKALEKQSRMLKRSKKLSYHIFEFKDSVQTIEGLHYCFDENEVEQIKELEDYLRNAKQFGSLIQLPIYDYASLLNMAKNYLTKETSDLFESSTQELFLTYLIPMLELAIAMNTKYDVVCTNPPYHNKFNSTLKTFMQKNYPDTKSDMYSAFIEKCFKWTTKNGYSAMMTPFTWMFIASHELLRKYIIGEGSISSLIQLEYSAFEDATVPLCTFILQNQFVNTRGIYIRLSDFKGGMDVQANKIIEVNQNINSSYKYIRDSKNFKMIPGAPIVYWISEKIIKTFEFPSLNSISESKAGIVSGEDALYLRLWFEIDNSKINYSAEDFNDRDTYLWVPINKGGSYRKYYGNYEYIINIFEIWNSKNINVSVRRSDPDYYFKPAVTWSYVTSGSPSFRITRNKLSATAAPNLFFEDDIQLYYSIGLLNSKISKLYLNFLNPTINLNVTNVSSIPIISTSNTTNVKKIVIENISLSKADWDSFENSWDFEKHPFLTYQNDSPKIVEVFRNWNEVAGNSFKQLKANEEELNSIFIDTYGFQDELTPEVEAKDVSVRNADVERDVRSFLSYLVGVVFGRYRLDKPGLAFAGGEFNLDEFGSYKPDKDNIIPITDEHYFEDDIVSKIAELVAIIYGEDTVTENLQFIATTLGMKESETAEDTIRRYFMKDFYKDHLKIYQKRPIYWQFSSGKKGAFKGLMYLHRYDKYTLARIRTDYVLKLTTTLNQLIEHAQVIIDGNVSAKEVARARKEREAYEAQLQELREYDLILKQLADQEIDLDLDDGVKVNYAKFQDIPFKKDNGRSEKMNLFEKI